MSPVRYSHEKLRAARTEQALMLEDLAVAARVSAQTIRRWENGEGAPDAEQLGAIANATGKSVSFFYTAVAA